MIELLGNRIRFIYPPGNLPESILDKVEIQTLQYGVFYIKHPVASIFIAVSPNNPKLTLTSIKGRAVYTETNLFMIDEDIERVIDNFIYQAWRT